MSIQSLRTGVSGLTANQTRLDTISNNISNSSTVAFKKERATFSQLLGQEVLGAERSASGDNVNPSKVGQGVSLGSIDKNFEQGSLDQTGIKTDLALSGDGFFVASPEEGAGAEQSRLTRAGDFNFNKDGELVTNGGLNVQGWDVGEDGEARTGELKNVGFDPNAKSPAKFTSAAEVGGNLSADAAVGEKSSISSVVYDEQGTAHDAVVDFQKTGSDNTWDFTVGAPSGVENTNGLFTTDAPKALQNEDGAFIDTDGNVIGGGSSGPNKDIATTAGYSVDDFAAAEETGSPPSPGFLDGDGSIIRSGGNVVSNAGPLDSISGVEEAQSVSPNSVEAWKDSNGDYITDENGDVLTVEDTINPPTVNNPDDSSASVDGTVTISRNDSSTPNGFLNEDDQLITVADGSGTGNVVSPDKLVENRENLPPDTNATDIGSTLDGAVTFDQDGSVKTINTESGDTSINWTDEVVEGGGSLSLDFTSLTQFSGSTTSKFQSQNGNAAGELADFGFTSEGQLQLSFTNGEQETAAQLAIGDVNNPNGLEQQGDNFFTTTAASGDLQLGRAGRDLQTSVESGSLESSNVDLADEFAGLIEAQRSYQASSRVVTTADQVLQETVGLKR